MILNHLSKELLLWQKSFKKPTGEHVEIKKERIKQRIYQTLGGEHQSKHFLHQNKATETTLRSSKKLSGALKDYHNHLGLQLHQRHTSIDLVQ